MGSASDGGAHPGPRAAGVRRGVCPGPTAVSRPGWKRPSAEFLDRLADVCGIDPPRAHGLDTVGTIQAMHRGEVKVFVGMGGNFALAAPDTPYTYAALRGCELTAQVSTKLNRSHLVHGRQALILPCLGRTEKDQQRRGVQSTSVEDSMSMVHLSVGMKRPASRHLLSEPAVIAGLARAALPASATPWERYVEDYDRIHDTMAQVLDGFEDFNRRVRLPLGFRIKQPARELVFHTPTGSAEISTAPLPDVVPAAGGLMNEDDMRERGIAEFGRVDITATARGGTTRSLDGYLAIPYGIPRGCAAGYVEGAHRPEMHHPPSIRTNASGGRDQCAVSGAMCWVPMRLRKTQ